MFKTNLCAGLRSFTHGKHHFIFDLQGHENSPGDTGGTDKAPRSPDVLPLPAERGVPIDSSDTLPGRPGQKIKVYQLDKDTKQYKEGAEEPYDPQGEYLNHEERTLLASFRANMAFRLNALSKDASKPVNAEVVQALFPVYIPPYENFKRQGPEMARDINGAYKASLTEGDSNLPQPQKDRKKISAADNVIKEKYREYQNSPWRCISKRPFDQHLYTLTRDKDIYDIWIRQDGSIKINQSNKEAEADMKPNVLQTFLSRINLELSDPTKPKTDDYIRRTLDNHLRQMSPKHIQELLDTLAKFSPTQRYHILTVWVGNRSKDILIGREGVININSYTVS
jgi:hypothetical protein